jgi:hypothetical protein
VATLVGISDQAGDSASCTVAVASRNQSDIDLNQTSLHFDTHLFICEFSVGVQVTEILLLFAGHIEPPHPFPSLDNF